MIFLLNYIYVIYTLKDLKQGKNTIPRRPLNSNNTVKRAL